jgi:hypothetical protein
VDTAIGVRATAASPQSAALVKTRIEEAVQAFINPARGGWPLGRNLYGSELHRLLSHVEGMSRLEAVELNVTGQGQLLKSDDGDVVGVNADVDELLRLRVDVVVQP